MRSLLFPLVLVMLGLAALLPVYEEAKADPEPEPDPPDLCPYCQGLGRACQPGWFWDGGQLWSTWTCFHSNKSRTGANL